MALIQWEEKYSVNVIELDKEHKRLLEMLNELHSAMKLGKSRELVEKLVNEAVDYCDKHLDHEEDLMKRCNYSGLSEHLKQHEIFRQKVTGFKLSLKKNNYTLSVGLISFFKDWFINHICTEDKKYSTNINNCKYS
ncbi:bacteriohemerythrin [Heliobacillus mobilis]|uniref:Bacteriohemerythrin n=1 Tax=Heliobacterium mobile TaxID=28064 RepID=A0A6I3SK27_HELMO|nr:bacteriohemerythrin [Heliobacterium mobile]MTV49271.1 bacteriohemerythrin [Heliobacterium mobile]